jgi:mannosyl-3-phosphoglycerate phosphatase family protein
VLCSSKTRAEVEHLSQDLAITHPFISERGSAVFVPDAYFAFEVPGAREMSGYHTVEFGRPYSAVVETLKRTAGRLGIEVRAFSDMSVEEVARECNIPLLQARLAKLREYAELFRILDPGLAVRERLVQALHNAHFRCIAGGRYHHIGADVDAAVGVHLLRTLYRRARGSIVTVGVEDAAADSGLLQCMEYPVIVRGNERRAQRRTRQEPRTARVTQAAGAAGWAEAVTDIVCKHRGRAPMTERSSDVFEGDRG